MNYENEKQKEKNEKKKRKTINEKKLRILLRSFPKGFTIISS